MLPNASKIGRFQAGRAPLWWRGDCRGICLHAAYWPLWNSGRDEMFLVALLTSYGSCVFVELLSWDLCSISCILGLSTKPLRAQMKTSKIIVKRCKIRMKLANSAEPTIRENHEKELKKLDVSLVPLLKQQVFCPIFWFVSLLWSCDSDGLFSRTRHPCVASSSPALSVLVRHYLRASERCRS